MTRVLCTLIAACLLLAAPLPVEAAARKISPQVNALTPDEVYSMTSDEIEATRDGLFEKGFENLSEDERFNAVMLDYYLNWADKTVRPRPSYGWERPVVGASYGPVWYSLNEQVSHDLNGDGINERITVAVSEDGVTLRVNRINIDCRYSGENLVDGFAVIDIDSEDGFKEIVISDTGSSDDDTSRFYAYDGKKIIYMNEGANSTLPMPEDAKEWASMDEIGGLYTYISGGPVGEITTLRRADVLQTWWFPVRYELTEGHLLRAVPEIFKADYDVFTLRDMPLFLDRNDESPKIQMKRGTLVTLTALDNTEWIQARLPDGQKGWFKIEGFDRINVEGEEIPAGEVFFYLYQVD